MNGSNSFETETDISRDILAYLSEHPLAQDTLEGVVEWWLLQQQVQRSITRVEAVLTELVRKGLLLERKEHDQRSHYRLNQSKLKAIREFLDQDRSS
jgi:predicted transcriptional regulator